MKLDTESWKYFYIEKLFKVEAGHYYYQDDYNSGNTPYCTASEANNGIGNYIDILPDFNGGKIITGKVGCHCFYEPSPFCATSDVNIMSPKFKMNEKIALFICTIITKNESFRWNYGRQCRVNNTKKISVKLPIQKNTDGTNKIDKSHQYSDEGFVPDWQFMEDYIKSLNHKPLTTENVGGAIITYTWSE